MGKKIALIALAVLALLSCENPIQSGLGAKVDITVPVISMVNPRNVGDHVAGVFPLEINAKDDIGVTKVQVAITKAPDGSLLPESAWKWENAVLDPVTGLWTYQVDTKLYPDGDLPVMIKAEDSTGKSVTFEGMYSSKNNPPEIEMQIPAMIEEPTPERHMELVTGGVMVGIAKDLWGVKQGFPQIQFWPRSEGENPSKLTEWHDLDSYASLSAEDWKNSSSGRTALEFRFQAVDHGDWNSPLDAMPNLQPGWYRFRFRIGDIDDTPEEYVTYPAEGYYELEVITARELPIIAVSAKAGDRTTLDSQYYREPFFIAAELSHTTGIYGASIKVQKEGEAESAILARGVYTDNADVGFGSTATKKRLMETFIIEPGLHYINTDVDGSDLEYGAVADYLFADGAYNFIIEATSVQTSYARQVLTVYIDTKPPEISITRVQPTVEALNPGQSGLDEYTVNGFIAVDMSAYDANNIGVIPDLNYREIKYLIKDDYDPNADPKALYDSSAARYFDNPAAPVYKRTGSTASVIIDTTHSDMVPGQDFWTPRNKYLYFIAKDKAGNYGFTAALLNVDQNTDTPTVTIAGFDFSQRSQLLLEAATHPNTLDTDRMLSGTFTDDDGVFVEGGGGGKLQIYEDGVAEPRADINLAPGDLTVLNDGKTVNFRVSLPNADELPDGIYSVNIRISDSETAKNLLKPDSLTNLPPRVFNTTNDAGRIYFVLDTQPPTLTETEIKDTTNGFALTADYFHLAGTIFDDNGLRSLKIIEMEAGQPARTIVDRSYTAPDNKGLKNWTLPPLSLPQARNAPDAYHRAGDPTAATADLRAGEFTYEIIAEDVSRKTAKLTRTVVVDRDPPTLTVDIPVQGAWVSSATVVVKGTEEDDNRTGPVFYTVGKTADPPPVFKASRLEYENDSIWKKLTFVGKDWSDSVDFQEGASPLGEGRYSLYVAAFDEAGNQAHEVRDFGVDYNLPYLDNWTPSGITEIGGSYYANTPYRFSFTARDTNALRNVRITRQDGEIPASSYLTPYPIPAAGAPSAVVSLPLHTGVNGGIYPYVIELTDVGNHVNNLENSSGDGVDRSASAFKNITVRWDDQGPDLSVSAPAAAAPPVLTAAPYELPVRGIAPDSGIPAGVGVYYAVNTGDTKPESGKPDASGSLPGWTRLNTDDFSLGTNIPVPGSEGAYYVHFIAYDQLGNQAVPVDRKFYVDKFAPQINDWTATPGLAPNVNTSFAQDNYTFSFKAYDSHGLKEVRITRGGTVLPYVSGVQRVDPVQGNYTITLAQTDARNWTVTASFTGQKDGEYAYGIEIEDVAGRINPAGNTNAGGTESGLAVNAFKTFTVTVDTTGPVALISQPNAGIPVNTDNMSISGTARDDLLPDTVKVYYLVDANDTVSSPPATSGAAVSANWTQAQGGATWFDGADLTGLLTQGEHYLHVIAFDELDNPGSVAHRRFVRDIEPPAIGADWQITNLNALVPSDSAYYYTTGGNFTIKFTAKDSNELKSVEIKENTLLLNSSTDPRYTLTIDKSDLTNREWPVTLVFNNQPNGNYAYEIIIKDSLNQENTANNNTEAVTTDDHKTFNIRVDTLAPALTVTNPSGGNDISAPTMLISGTAADATTEDLTVWYSIDTNSYVNATAPTTAALASASPDWEEAPGGVSWYKDDVDLPLTEGTYYAHFVAFDKLGNRSGVQNRTIYIDYNLPYMDNWSAPAIKEIPADSGSYYAAGAYTLSFTARDSNALSGVGITRSGDNVTGDANFTPNPYYGEDSVDVSLSHTGLNGGIYSYVIELTDIRNKVNNLENTSGGTTYTASAHKNITVRVDTQGPDLSVSAPAEGNPPILITNQLPVRGIAPDSGIPAGVRVYYAVDTNDTKLETLKPEDSAFATHGWTPLDTDDFSLGTNIPVPGSEGAYYVHFIAYDQLGTQAVPVDRKFYVDLSAPQIKDWSATPALAPNANTNLTQKNYTFNFTAYDSNKLDSLTIYRNNIPLAEDNTLLTVDRITDPTGKSWPVTLDFTNQIDGNYNFVIEINDIAGKQNLDNNSPGSFAMAYKNFSVRVDTNGPVVSISQPTAGIPVNTGNMSISGTATDALTPDNVKVYYLIDANDTVASPPATSGAAVSANWIQAQGESSWFDGADLTGILSEGVYYVHVIAFDELDNSGSVAHRQFILDRGPPQIDAWGITPLNSIVGSDAAYYYPANGAFTISFTAKDSNQLQSVEIKRNNTLLSEGAQTGYTLTIDKATYPGNKEWPVTLALTGQGNANYAYEIIIKDTLDQENRSDNGTDSDATDDHKTFTVRVDTAGPVLSVLNPSGGNEIGSPAMLVSGTAADATTEDLKVYYSIDTNSNATAPATAALASASPDWEEAPGGVSWTKSDVSLTAVGEGTRYVHFVAFDKLGNRSAVTNKTIYVDYHLPYMDNWTPTGITNINGSYYANGPYGFSFNAKDSNALQGVKITRSGADVTATINPALPGTGVTSANVSLSHTGTNGGYYPYVIELTDTRGKFNNLENTSGDSAIDSLPTVTNSAFKNLTVWVDTQGPDLSVSAPSADTPPVLTSNQLPVRGTAPDSGIPAGVRIYYAVDTNAAKLETLKPEDSAFATHGWTLLNTDNFSAGTNVTLSGGMENEGVRYAHFIAYDQLGNQAAPVDRIFYVDKFAPQINGWTSTRVTQKPSDAPSLNLLKYDNYDFTFTAHDTNSIKDLRLTRGGTVLPYVSGVPQTDPVQGNYTVTVTGNAQNRTLAVSFTGQADGDYVYGIEIEDIAGRINPANNIALTENGAAGNAFKTFNVSVDTTGPDLTITTPAVDALVRSTDLIAVGTADDATIDGITVWYAVDDIATKASPADPSDPGASGWTAATANWTATADLTGKPEGYLYLHVIAYDKLLNTTGVLNRRFSVDISPPQILDFAFTGSPKTFADDPVTYVGPAYGFTFKANDTNALSSVVVTRNGVALTSGITLSPAAPFPADTKTVNVTVSLTGQQQGNNDYTITITDTAGQQNTENNNTDSITTDDHKTFTVRVDTAGPVLVVDNPVDTPTVEISGSVINVNGTATDLTTNGLSVWFKVDAAATATAPASAAAAPGAGWTEAPGGTIWSKSDVSLTTVGEGTRYVHFAGFDKLGNVSAVTNRTIFYDANPPYMKDWAATNVVEINESYYAKGPYTLSFNAYDSNALYVGGNPLSVQVIATSGGDTYNLVEGTNTTDLGGYKLTVTKTDVTTWTWPVSLELTNPNNGSVSYEFIITDTRGKKNALDNLPGTDADAHKRITVRTDKQGPALSIAEPYSGQSITGNSLQISGVATDTGIPDLVPVYYRVTNGSGSVAAPATRTAATADPNWKPATANASWNTGITLDAGVSGEGEKRIHFAAYDQLDNSTLVSQAFYVDFAAPHIKTWTSSDIATYSASNLINKNNFTFTFDAYDSNALDSVAITRGETALTVDGSAHSDAAGSYTITRTVTDARTWRYAAAFTNQTDGDYVYGIEIKDIAGKINPDDNAPVAANRYKTFSVRIDTAGPVLAFTEPADNSTVSGSTITIGGTANDALTPAGVTVWYAIDGSNTIAAPSYPPSGLTWTQTDGSADWYKNAAIGSVVEGLLYVHAVAFDSLGNRSNLAHKPFYVDISPPVIDNFGFTSITTDSGVNFAGKAYGFTFKARDSNALQSVKVSRDGAELFTATAAGSGSGSGFNYILAVTSAKEWTVTVNLTGQNDGNYAFNIEVKDIAGRENALDNSTAAVTTDDYKTFGVRVDTAGPVLDIVDPAVNMAASGNRLYIGGTAPDALTSDGIAAYYKIDAVSNTAAPANMTATIADPAWILAPGGAFWSHNAVLDSSGGEGYRYLHVIAYDKLGNPSDLKHRIFFVDVNPPQILNWDDSASTGINFSDTPYYAGKNYTIRFDAYDSNTLAGGVPSDSQSLVTITRNGIPLVAGGAQSDGPGSYTLTITDTDSQTWPVTLALTNQPDGNYSYSIEIRDATGKENTLDNNTGANLTDDRKSFTIVVDSTPPNTSLTMAPATVSNEGQDFVLANGALARSDNVNGVIEFAASAMDASGLEGVKWFIIPDSPTPAFNPAANAKTLYDDSRGTLFAANSYTALYDTTTAPNQPGHYSLYILARDKAGNVGYNTTTSFGFYIDQRTDRPVVTFTNLSKDGSNDPVVGSGFILRGTVKDDDGVDPATFKINLFDGANWYNGTNWTASSAVDLTIPAGSITGSGREYNFAYSFPNTMIDGPAHRVLVKAADLPASKTGSPGYGVTNAAKTGSTEMTFVLDVTTPVITVTQDIDSTYIAAAASISGTLTEMHPDVFRVRVDALDYIDHIVNVNPNAGNLVLTSWNSTTGLGTWTYKLPILDFSLTAGLHTLTLEAVDKAGLATTYLWRFYVDDTGPVISFRIDATPYPTWGTLPTGMNILREGDRSLRGDFRDDFSLVDTSSFDYRFDDQTGWTATTPGVATITNPGKNPSWALSLENLPAPYASVMPDGPHRVQIRVRDALGNTTTSAWIGFRVDTTDPAIINIDPPEADAVFGGVNVDPMFTLKGTVEDANLSSITLTLNSGVATPVTVPAGASSVNFTHQVAKTVFDALSQGSNRFVITATDEAGRSKTVEWNFIKDTQPPTIEWSNLNNQTGNNSSMFQDSANLKIVGVARDANGVHTLTTVIEKYISNAWTQVEGTFDLTPGDEPVKNWIKDIALLPAAAMTPALDGLYRIRVNAVDRGGNVAAPQTREFRVDLDLPAVSIDTSTGTHPLKSFYNGKATGSGPIVVSGRASDANGITGVTATLSGALAPAWAVATAAYNAGAGTWEVTIPHENPGNTAQKLPQGGYTLNITATDNAGRTNTAYGTFTFDSVDPTSTIDLPVKYGRVTGSVAIRGSNNDTGTGVAQMYYQFTKMDTDPDTWRQALVDQTAWTGGLYSWNFTFTASNYFTASYGTEVSFDGTTTTPTADTGLWEVPFKIRVVDQAGNETIINDYYLLLDAKGDIPRIEISNPASGSILGGRVYISGTAQDNNYINHIQYRVKPNPTLGPDEWNGINWINASPVSGDFLTGSGIGPSVTWQFDINGDGSLNPASGDGMRPVLVQVRAIDAPQGLPNDTNGAPSDPVSVLIYFDAGVPRIGGERVANNVSALIPFPTLMDNGNSVAYVDGLQVSKKFVFEASIQDDSGLETIQYWRDGALNGPNAIGTGEVVAPDIVSAGTFIPGRKYMIDTVGNTDWIAIGANSNTHGASFTATGIGSGTGKAYEATAAGEFVYKLRFMIPSNELLAYTDKTGHFTINIMALDNSSPQLRADRSYTLQVDNFYPFGTYTSPNVAASWYNLRGTARDFDATSGPIQGLDKVVVYFSRAGTFIPLKEPGTASYTADPHPWSGATQAVRKASDGSPATVTFPADQYSGITIDRDEQGAGTDQDGDGYEEAWYDNGADKVWSARFDTLQLKDGPVTVHYVIFDKAGNATYYEYTVFIKNHAPVIMSVTLGTDIAGNKTIGGTRLYTTGYFTTPPFVARNQRLSFNVKKDGGNGAAHYRITHVTQQPVAANAIIAGNIYTINAVGSTDWMAIGAASNTAGITFVATSNGGGSGTAYGYAQSGGTTVVKEGVFLGDETTGAVLYDNFTDMSDNDEAYFLVKVWDTTTTGPESDQLSDMIVVRVKIENNDAVKPASRLYDLSPYARDLDKNVTTTLTNLQPTAIGVNLNMGGLYMTGTGATAAISGHVEPRGNSAGSVNIFLEKNGSGQYVLPNLARDKISGKVILRGYAFDNQRLSEISLKFNNGTAIKIIGTNTANGRLVPVGGTVQSWVFDDLTLDGHEAEWAYVWDTQTVPGTTASIVQNNLTVQVIAGDAHVSNYGTNPYTLDPNQSVRTDQSAANNVNYNYIGMDTAPYISGLTTWLSNAYKSNPSTFDRSALGWYPVRQGETITINGFNFNGTSPAVTLNGATVSGTTVVDMNKITAPISADALLSGPLVVRVNSINSNNNANSNTASYHQEANNMNNSTLTDDRYLYVWNTGYLINNNNITNPFFRMDPSSNWYASYGKGSDTMQFNKNSSELSYLEQCYNKFHNTTIAFDSSGNAYGGATNTDRINNNVTGATSFTFYSRARGDAYDGDISHYSNGTNKRRLELSYNGSTGQYNIRRVEVPRIAVTGAGTTASPAKVYMSYFDGNNNASPVVFRYGTVNATSDSANNIAGDISSNITSNNPGTATGARIVANNTTTYKGGLYTAVGGLSTGRAVIAWYDADAGQLVYSYSQGVNPSDTTTAQWQANARVIDSQFAGWHVDLAVDGNNGIHIAYYSSGGGDLKYAYLSSYNAAPQVVTVDSYLSAGTKLMINTRQESRSVNGVNQNVYVPYISYYHASFPQTSNSVRVAWRNNFNALTDGAVLDDFTGAWESMTVPTANVPIEDFVCNGVPSSGTTTGGNLNNISLTNTMLVTYMTNAYYERAYIKK